MANPTDNTDPDLPWDDDPEPAAGDDETPADSAWLRVRDDLVDALAEAGFPVNGSELYTPEFITPPEAEPCLFVSFSEMAFQSEEAGLAGADESLSFNLHLLGYAPDLPATDRMVALTERLYCWLAPVGEEGHYNRPLGNWEIQDVEIVSFYGRPMLYGKKRRWVGLIKVRCHVLT